MDQIAKIPLRESVAFVQRVDSLLYIQKSTENKNN